MMNFSKQTSLNQLRVLTTAIFFTAVLIAFLSKFSFASESPPVPMPRPEKTELTEEDENAFANAIYKTLTKSLTQATISAYLQVGTKTQKKENDHGETVVHTDFNVKNFKLSSTAMFNAFGSPEMVFESDPGFDTGKYEFYVGLRREQDVHDENYDRAFAINLAMQMMDKDKDSKHFDVKPFSLIDSLAQIAEVYSTDQTQEPDEESNFDVKINPIQGLLNFSSSEAFDEDGKSLGQTMRPKIKRVDGSYIPEEPAIRIDFRIKGPGAKRSKTQKRKGQKAGTYFSAFLTDAYGTFGVDDNGRTNPRWVDFEIVVYTDIKGMGFLPAYFRYRGDLVDGADMFFTLNPDDDIVLKYQQKR